MNLERLARVPPVGEPCDVDGDERVTRPLATGTSRWSGLGLRLPYWLLAIAIPVAQFWTFVLTDLDGRVQSLGADDGFFYFKIAANYANGLGSTFDGINPTNGYQPLWFWIIVGVFKVSPDRMAALVWINALMALLWMTTVAIGYRIARILGTLAGGIVGLSALMLLVYNTWFTGVELPLVIVLILAVVWLLLRSCALTGRGPSLGSAAALGALMAAVTMARLDAVITCAALGLGVLLAPTAVTLSRRIAVGVLVAAPVVVTLGVYMLVNQTAFGTPLPISGQAKQLGGVTNPRWENITDYLLHGQIGAIPLCFGAVTVALSVLVLQRQFGVTEGGGRGVGSDRRGPGVGGVGASSTN